MRVLITDCLSNISDKKYQHRFMSVKVIARLKYSDVFETQCTRLHSFIFMLFLFNKTNYDAIKTGFILAEGMTA